ncbi:DUF2026 domain-containing protein [Asaia krungthepensis]|uniref:Uncharacterized protein n=1 Tax=Asaia krungthepensis NRIC 0535 TaxID=1307925 RepID=A0ABQ0Q3A0_9PROT|nr:DUF2026 domain-containing protein [Asaia krungthepensis]GBQ89311.1 hypothetical protein AA0535_1762 [Asaia krungthepensis NRIC 0535]
MAKFVIGLSDYMKIHKIIHALLLKEGNKKPETGCTLFASVGAFLLQRHYKIKARPVAGAFVLCVDSNDLLMYGKLDNGNLVSDNQNFHMWVETETHLIDFMSPLLQESFANTTRYSSIARRMLQKPLMEEKQNVSDCVSRGDFAVFENHRLTNDIVSKLSDTPLAIDFFSVADKWFGKRSRKQADQITIMDTVLGVSTIRLPQIDVNQCW